MRHGTETQSHEPALPGSAALGVRASRSAPGTLGGERRTSSLGVRSAVAAFGVGAGNSDHLRGGSARSLGHAARPSCVQAQSASVPRHPPPSRRCRAALGCVVLRVKRRRSPASHPLAPCVDAAGRSRPANVDTAPARDAHRMGCLAHGHRRLREGAQSNPVETRTRA
jgi:hypothetical protein